MYPISFSDHFLHFHYHLGIAQGYRYSRCHESCVAHIDTAIISHTEESADWILGRTPAANLLDWGLGGRGFFVTCIYTRVLSVKCVKAVPDNGLSCRKLAGCWNPWDIEQRTHLSIHSRIPSAECRVPSADLSYTPVRRSSDANNDTLVSTN